MGDSGIRISPAGFAFVPTLNNCRLPLPGNEQVVVNQIRAFTADAGSEISCGLRKPANPVVICYVPTTDLKARYDGHLRSVEFVPNDFKLQSKK